ncbi:testis-expressed protein 36 isoform X7 [Canis lupus familiaris]|uniref:testis-expressed protein 36 isoform X7 n=1 Tax=Canis lupus familiaris TaxID=9615 RepID=UPI0006B3CD9A|nr:testis-expressed protein 36 isoform X7 [Canis lupus familiaris]XP_038296805.1 testis-expressed protein 36 isoform X7 [Canis lupus familiaris]XP_038434994.1 testis-expressed protein 36 isoform X7 [Canis lupus familiaris]|eukprot:XP_013964300.1 testis-expressed protein 36 isoform X5 [Canis lupus familiaris]
MAKGRRFNPALDKDGRWRVLVFQFPQIGLTQKTPESSTSAVLKEPHRPHLSRQVEERLPPIYKVREKQAVNNNFPFSVHDNRHSFQSSGCYLDSGLGRRKISPEKRQHVSRNFNLWADGSPHQKVSTSAPPGRWSGRVVGSGHHQLPAEQVQSSPRVVSVFAGL